LSDWDSRYRDGRNTDNKPSELLSLALDYAPPGRALDLACGGGRNSIYLAENGWEVSAVDASVEGLKLARLRAAERKVEIEFVNADLEKGGFEIGVESFDLIADFFYLQRDLWPDIRAGLKPGGLFVSEIHLESNAPGLKAMNPLFLLRPGELLNEFSGWKIEHFSEGVRVNSGARPTARIIARRSSRD
jgi:SAM-dependent methyltransferase